MDYSHLQDEENPAGASPWGASPASSPKPDRTSFGSLGATADDASNGDTNGGAARIDDEGGFGASDTESRRPGTSSTASEATDAAATTGETHYSHEEHQPFDQTQPPARGHEPEPPSQDAANRKPVQPSLKLQAKVTGLERTGRKDAILRFDVHTNIPKFRTTQYRDVRRLHSEFVKLAEHLISANPETFVPAVPPSLTSAGVGTEEDEIRVKALMQRWLNYVCSNEVLTRDDEVVLFVESDFGYSPVVKKKQPATGVRRKILKQFAPPPDDTPELQDARPVVKLFYLGTMDAGHKVDKLVKSRRGLGLAESDFGVKLGSMSVQEPQPGLANAYRKLGKVIQTVGDCHAAQATAEATTLGDPFQYHSSDAFIVKETLTNRQILKRELLQAEEHTRTRTNAADRVRASSNVRREKVDEAIAALDEARESEAYLQHKNMRVTRNLVHERRRWFNRTSGDLRLAMREFVLREIEAERRILSLLESVRPDVRAIDASGGLSRLGREAHPAVRRTSLASSQGPKGDAWSGVPRRSDAGGRSMSGSFMGSPGASGAGSEEHGGELGGDHPSGDDVARTGRGLSGVSEEDDEDRIDARNAASRLATSTF